MKHGRQVITHVVQLIFCIAFFDLCGVKWTLMPDRKIQAFSSSAIKGWGSKASQFTDLSEATY